MYDYSPVSGFYARQLRLPNVARALHDAGITATQVVFNVHDPRAVSFYDIAIRSYYLCSLLPTFLFYL
jgi:hypothetical protein